MPLFNNMMRAQSAAEDDFALLFSTKYSGNASNYLSHSGPNGDRTEFIVSFWFRCTGAGSTRYIICSGYSGSTDSTNFTIDVGAGSDNYIYCIGHGTTWLKSSGEYNDGEWHHCLISAYTNDATANDRMEMYVDGVFEVNGSSGTGQPTSGQSLGWNQNANHYIGRQVPNTNAPYNGNLAQFVSLSGVSLQQGDYSISDFYNNGPVDVEETLTFGANDFLLSMQDRGDVGRDFSGNDIHFTENGTVDWTRNRPYAHDTLYLPFDGSNGSTTFEDKSLWRIGPTTVGGDAQISTAQSKFGGSSGLFDGTGDYLQWTSAVDAGRTNLTNREPWALGCWVRLGSTAGSMMICERWASNVGYQLYYRSADTSFTFYLNSGIVLTSTTSPTTGTWYHVAITWDGTTLRMFVNGTSEDTATGIANPETDVVFTIGRQEVGTTLYWNGYIDDFFIHKGDAVWTSNFTAPTSARGASNPHPDFLTTVFKASLTLDSANIGDYSIRNVCSTMSVVSEDFDEVRVTWEADSTNGLDMDNIAIGIRNGSTDDTTATPTEILVGGASGFSASGGEKKTSDWTTFAFNDGTDDLLVIGDVASGTQNVRYANSGYDGDYIQASANTYNTATVTMSFTASRSFGVQRVEGKTLQPV